MSSENYLSIIRHYENCLSRYGDSHRGVDWPNHADALKRYKVMLELTSLDSCDQRTILDFGCGASHFYGYLQSIGRDDLIYIGLEISEEFYNLSKSKYADIQYILADIIKTPEVMPIVDYVVMNGVFTEKLNLSFDEMEKYFQKMIELVYKKTKIGVSFNLMSKSVDWERDDLFHYPLDRLSNFLCKNVSRNFIVRNDYGLYEYTVYVYK